MSAWTTVTAAAGGVVGVQSTTVKSGTKAAQLSETTGAGSIAYARTVLSGDQTDLTATGAFMVTAEGAANANVPIFRFLDATGARAISLYRQNASGNHIWVKVGNGSAAQTTGLLPLSTWGVLSLHTIVAGTTSTISVSLNGSNIYTTTAATLTSPMRTVQIGNDTASQTFGIVVDDVQLAGGGTAAATRRPPTPRSPAGPAGRSPARAHRSRSRRARRARRSSAASTARPTRRAPRRRPTRGSRTGITRSRCVPPIPRGTPTARPRRARGRSTSPTRPHPTRRS